MRGVWGLAATKIPSDSTDATSWEWGLRSSTSDSSVPEPGVRLPGCAFTRLKVAHLSISKKKKKNQTNPKLLAKREKIYT